MDKQNGTHGKGDLMQQTLSGNVLDNETIIKTTSFDQQEIIQNIIDLYCPDGIELDPTYSKGNFYKGTQKPKYVYDLNPQNIEVIQADCRHLPHESDTIESIMFDPPFIAAMPKGDATGIITKRFGYYKNVPIDLWNMYNDALIEFYRILKPNGVLIFKCQDTIEHNKQYLTHVEIIIKALGIGYYPKDMFILLAKNRIIGKHHHKQQHARKFHSYFLVLIKKTV